jgi:hypothetical protein
MRRFVLLLFVVSAFVTASAQETSSWKISGLAFGDYFYNVSRDTSATGSNAKNYNGFQFRRIYLSFDKDLTDKFAFRFRTEDDQSQLFAGGKIGSFVKDAYLKWKGVFPGSDFTFGMQPTPAFDISEGLWGYRSLEKTIMDLRSVVDSRDLGISLKGKIDGDGMFGYWIMVGNGAGTSKPETDKYKRYYFNLQAKPISNLTITLYQDYASTAPGTKGADKDKATTALFADYGVKGSYNVGAELFSQNATNAAVSQGYSFFGSYNFTSELAAIARYDIYDPNTSSAVKGDKRNLLIAGVSYAADKNVFIQPNVEYETYESSTVAGKSYTPDAALTARLTFFFTF